MISSTNIKLIFLKVDWLGNIWTLFINGDYNNGCFIVHTDLNWIITDFLNSLTCYLLEVDFGFSADLTEDHTYTILNWALTSNFWSWILCEAGIKNRVRNIVTKFIWVTASYVLWGKEEMSRLKWMVHWNILIFIINFNNINQIYNKIKIIGRISWIIE